MAENNLTVWDKMKTPPKEALKTITGGRLKGKTDINPQWRYQAMTEQFGMCGVGWHYEVEQVWKEPLEDGQVFAFAKILLFIGDGKPIPGIGGSMLVEKETAGLHASDEGYKMAITDALSVAMKMIGVGADIYAGLFDGSKYKNEPDKPPAQKHAPKATTAKSEATDDGLDRFYQTCMKAYALAKEKIADKYPGLDLTTPEKRKTAWEYIDKQEFEEKKASAQVQEIEPEDLPL